MSSAAKFKSRFVRDVMATFVAKVSAAAVGLLTSVLIARALGPDGRGTFAAVMMLTATGMQFANLGLHSSNSYYLSRDQSILRAVIGNSVYFALALGTLAGLILMGIAWAAGIVASAGTLTVGVAMLSIPVGLAYMLLVNLLVPLHAINAFNSIEFGMRGATCVMTGVVCFTTTPSPGLFVLVALVAQLFGVGAVWKTLDADSSSLQYASRGMLFKQIPFAFRAYLASLLGFLLLRSDILMVQSISGNKELGYYSIAVAMADMIYLLPASVGMLLLPRLIEISDSKARRLKAWKAVLTIGIVMAAISVIAAMLAHFAIGVLYGQAFLPAVPMFQILLVAIVFYGMSNLLCSYLAATGLPWGLVWVWVFGLAINVVMNLALVPHMGGKGAAVASLVAYVLVWLALCALVLREKGVKSDHRA
jgi:O-antigen/teichoic acid export membrane protein